MCGAWACWDGRLAIFSSKIFRRSLHVIIRDGSTKLSVTSVVLLRADSWELDALLFPLSQNATGGVPQTEKGKHCVCQQGGVVLIPKEEASMQRQNSLQPPGYCEHTQLSRFGWAEHLMNTLYHDDLFFFFFLGRWTCSRRRTLQTRVLPMETGREKSPGLFWFDMAESLHSQEAHRWCC